MENQTVLVPVRTRILSAVKDIGTSFQEREQVAYVLAVAMLSGTNPLLLGPPGTAKSAVLRAMCAHVSGAKFFDKLMTPFTTEDELVGPPKISALRDRDVFERNLSDGLAGCEIGFLDEVFKASSAALNCMLTMINEHSYGGKSIPLRIAVAASNETPTEEFLMAIRDRFLLCVFVDDLQKKDAFEILLQNASDPSKRSYRPKPGNCFTLSEWDFACVEVAAVKVPGNTIAACAKIRDACLAQNIYVSPRRWVNLIKVIQAVAWLDGCQSVEVDHLDILRHGLWIKTEDREQVAAIVDSLDNGTIGQIAAYADDALRRFETWKLSAPKDKQNDSSRIFEEIGIAAEAICAKAKGTSSRTRAKAQTKLSELETAREFVKQELLKRIGL